MPRIFVEVESNPINYNNTMLFIFENVIILIIYPEECMVLMIIDDGNGNIRGLTVSLLGSELAVFVHFN